MQFNQTSTIHNWQPKIVNGKVEEETMRPLYLVEFVEPISKFVTKEEADDKIQVQDKIKTIIDILKKKNLYISNPSIHDFVWVGKDKLKFHAYEKLTNKVNVKQVQKFDFLLDNYDNMRSIKPLFVSENECSYKITMINNNTRVVLINTLQNWVQRSNDILFPKTQEYDEIPFYSYSYAANDQKCYYSETRELKNFRHIGQDDANIFALAVFYSNMLKLLENFGSVPDPINVWHFLYIYDQECSFELNKKTFTSPVSCLIVNQSTFVLRTKNDLNDQLKNYFKTRPEFFRNKNPAKELAEALSLIDE